VEGYCHEQLHSAPVPPWVPPHSGLGTRAPCQPGIGLSITTMKCTKSITRWNPWCSARRLLVPSALVLLLVQTIAYCDSAIAACASPSSRMGAGNRAQW